LGICTRFFSQQLVQKKTRRQTEILFVCFFFLSHTHCVALFTISRKHTQRNGHENRQKKSKEFVVRTKQAKKKRKSTKTNGDENKK